VEVEKEVEEGGIEKELSSGPVSQADVEKEEKEVEEGGGKELRQELSSFLPSFPPPKRRKVVDAGEQNEKKGPSAGEQNEATDTVADKATDTVTDKVTVSTENTQGSGPESGDRIGWGGDQIVHIAVLLPVEDSTVLSSNMKSVMTLSSKTSQHESEKQDRTCRLHLLAVSMNKLREVVWKKVLQNSKSSMIPKCSIIANHNA
jgi:hypothetical protein